MSNGIIFRVWGARGSIFAGGPEHEKYGGDTTCFSVEAAGRFVVVDAGSGVRALGQHLMNRVEGPPDEIDLLLTHLHIDHICGLPFFAPLLTGATTVRLWNSVYPSSAELRGALSRGLAPPIFPVDTTMWDALAISVPDPGERVTFGEANMARAFPLHHPDQACGWRINADGRIIVIASDHEHGKPEVDAQVEYYARDADMMVWDASYTDDEIAAKQGWGHSTWRQGLEVGNKAGVNRLLMTHHMPDRTDEELMMLEHEARGADERILFARERMVLRF